MPRLPTLDETREFIAQAHQGQTDRGGQSYVAHPLAVAQRLELLAPRFGITLTDHMRHAALLHDVLEDTKYTEEDLRARGYHEDTLEILALVGPKRTQADMPTPHSAQHQQWYRASIQRIVDSGNAGAMLVKLADNLENCDPTRRQYLDAATNAWLTQKYAGIEQLLTDGIIAASGQTRSTGAQR